MDLNYITNGTNKVILGSGQLYAIETPSTDTVPDTASMVNIGFIESNASLKASATTTDVRSANSGKVGTVQKDKNVEFSTGIISWDLKNVSDFLTGSEFVINTETGTKTFTYCEDDSTPTTYLRFISEDLKAKKRITVNMFRCNFKGELNLDFNTEKPITFDYTFDVLMSILSGKKKYFEVIEEDITE